ncbi:hypothetical protein, partial [Aulosira sp. FACHB-615]|uniref:hypothetical protein n=1 Tax=Aulosira sp. FACHB-615 TaxID=2692777 RepID=UPI001A7F0A99
PVLPAEEFGRRTVVNSRAIHLNTSAIAVSVRLLAAQAKLRSEIVFLLPTSYPLPKLLSLIATLY